MSTILQSDDTACLTEANPTEEEIGFSCNSAVEHHCNNEESAAHNASSRALASAEYFTDDSSRSDGGDDDGDDDSCDSGSELTANQRSRCNSLDRVYPGNEAPSGNKRFSRKAHNPEVRLRFAFEDMESSADVNSLKKDINVDLGKLSRKVTGSVRYTQPRLSLLGRPINYKMHRRDMRYRRMQAKVYNFLERPKAWYAIIYHISICLTCISALVCSTLSTIKDFEPQMSRAVMYMEPVLLLWLLVEYSLRVWASGCRSRYQGWQGRIKFAQRPLCIIDLVIIIATLMVILVGTTSEMFAASTLRGLRFFQILRMVRIDRRAGTWKLLASVIWAHRRELLTALYIGFLGLLFSSYMVYLAEKDHDSERFGTYADALWWGVVTLCTVGYGDVVPGTWAGKLIASFSAVLGIAFFALPAGILGSGFALKVQQQQRQKHLIRRRVPAALLIQSLWRCYAADENSMSIATWKPHMYPCPSPVSERPLKNNPSFVSRFSTRRKDRGVHSTSNNHGGNVSPHSPVPSRRENRKNGVSSEEDVPDTLQSLVNRTWSHLSLATGLVDQRVDKIASIKDGLPPLNTRSDHHYDDEQEVSPKVRELTGQHKKAIRALRKIRYFVARKKFREALRPYDVKDVIEQYSAGHVDMLGRVKSLQCRLDQILGKAGSKNKDVYESNVSLSSRIVKVERQVEDIETKLDLLIDMYKDDRKTLLQAVAKPQDNTGGSVDGHQSNKPRSILIDKQASEPSSPISNKHPKRVMLRNHSDLSSRIRKRVTYRLHSAPVGSQYDAPAVYSDSGFIPENTLSEKYSKATSERDTMTPDSEISQERTSLYANNLKPEDCWTSTTGEVFDVSRDRRNGSGSDVSSNSKHQVTRRSGFGRGQETKCSLTSIDKHETDESEEDFRNSRSSSQRSLPDISFCDPITPDSPKDFGNGVARLTHDCLQQESCSQGPLSDTLVMIPLASSNSIFSEPNDV